MKHLPDYPPTSEPMTLPEVVVCSILAVVLVLCLAGICAVSGGAW